MALRLTDTDKWKKTWFRNLTPLQKCFWQYLCDNCNHAGIWEIDFNLAEFMIGEKLDEKNLREQFKKQYIEIDNGKRWFIIDFVNFQYNVLNPKVSCHKSVLRLLSPYKNLLKGYARVGKGLSKGCQTLKDIAKDKDKDNINITSSWYQEIKKDFPEIDVDAELSRMNLWLKDNPRKNHKKTFRNWLINSKPNKANQKANFPEFSQPKW